MFNTALNVLPTQRHIIIVIYFGYFTVVSKRMGRQLMLCELILKNHIGNEEEKE